MQAQKHKSNIFKFYELLNLMDGWGTWKEHQKKQRHCESKVQSSDLLALYVSIATDGYASVQAKNTVRCPGSLVRLSVQDHSSALHKSIFVTSNVANFFKWQRSAAGESLAREIYKSSLFLRVEISVSRCFGLRTDLSWTLNWRK